MWYDTLSARHSTLGHKTDDNGLKGHGKPQDGNRKLRKYHKLGRPAWQRKAKDGMILGETGWIGIKWNTTGYSKRQVGYAPDTMVSHPNTT